MAKQVYVKIEFSNEGLIKLTKENGFSYVYRGEKINEIRSFNLESITPKFNKNESNFKVSSSILATAYRVNSKREKGNKIKNFFKDLKKVIVDSLAPCFDDGDYLYLEINKDPKYVKVPYTKELHDRVVEAHNYKSEFSKHHHSNFS